MADYILVVQLEIPEAHEAEFNRLYDEEHVPSLVSVPGCSGAQRYKLEGEGQNMQRYLAIYQVDSPETPYSEEWKRKSETEGWMTVRPHITDLSRGVFRTI